MSAIATLQGSPLRFHVSPEYADACIDRIGTVVQHDVFGPLFCHEIHMDKQGNVSTIVFIGTCKNDFPFFDVINKKQHP